MCSHCHHIPTPTKKQFFQLSFYFLLYIEIYKRGGSELRVGAWYFNDEEGAAGGGGGGAVHKGRKKGLHFREYIAEMMERG